MPVLPTPVMLISKEPFMRTFGEVIRKANLSRIEMLNKIPIFTQWSLAQLALLYKHFSKLDLQYNKAVYQQGDTDDNIYIILKGEIELETLYEGDDHVAPGLMLDKSKPKKAPLVV